MALSPLDFYAYSRATGAPVPESPEERAEMAPEVLEFRRNQLKAPQEESNPLAALGAAALGLGALAGIGFGARRLMRREPQAPKAPAKSATAGVRQVNLADMEQAVRRVAAEPAPSTPPPTSSSERLRVYEAVAAKPESELPRVYRPKGGLEDILPEERAEELNVLITDPRTGEIFRRGQSPQSFAQTYISLRPELTGQKTNLPLNRTPGTFKEFSEAASLTDVQKAQTPLHVDQLVNAVESGEDQMTGRVIKQLSIADPWGEATVPPTAVNEQTATQFILPASESAESLTRVMSSQDLADVAKSEMIELRQALQERGLRPGTERFNRALAQSWATKSIPGAEPGTAKFRELQDLGKIDVALPSTVLKAVEAVERMGEEEALQTAFLKSVPNIGPGAVVTETAAGTAIRGAAPTYQVVEKQAPTRQIFGTPDPLVPGAPDELMPDYPSAYTALHQLLTQSQLPERIDPYAVKRLKGGSAGIGVYGLESGFVPGAMSKATGEYSKASTRKPTYVPDWLRKQQDPILTGFERLSTDTIKSLIAGEGKFPLSKTRAQLAQDIIEQRQRTIESIALSEVIRRGGVEGILSAPPRTIQGPREATEKTYQYPQSFLTERPEEPVIVSAPIRLAGAMQGPKTPPVQGPKEVRTVRMNYETSPLTPEEQFIAALELEAEKQKMTPEDVILKTMATTPSKIKRSEQRLPGPAYLSAYAKQRGYF